MPDHRTEATVSGDGSLTIPAVPFAAGERVEVVVRARAESPPAAEALRGSVRRYDDPFEPAAADDDWEAA